MSVIYVLIACSIVIALVFLGMFIWSVKSGQYEDTYTPSVRMLFEEKKESGQNSEPEKASADETKKPD